ncbi:MAG: hypothetical protein WD032_03280, partial [Nitrospirales bacterium]
RPLIRQMNKILAEPVVNPVIEQVIKQVAVPVINPAPVIKQVIRQAQRQPLPRRRLPRLPSSERDIETMRERFRWNCQ